MADHNDGGVALTAGAPASKQERETLAGGAADQQGSSPAAPASSRVEGRTQSGIRVITCEDFVKARPWICCRDPYVVGREEDGTPLVAQCDKRIGHAGKHRGRFDGNTYIWRMRNTHEIKAEMERRQRAVDEENDRAAEAARATENDPNKE